MIRNQLDGSVPVAVLEGGHPEEEYLCNLFAAELLVPRSFLLRAIHKFGLTPSVVLWLGDVCDVSSRVVTRRLGDTATSSSP